MSGNLLLPGCRERTWDPGEDYARHPSGLWVPGDTEDAVPAPELQPLGIDLFAGAGGFSCGFKMAGWHIVAANEWDVNASHTYLANLGSQHTQIVFCTSEDEERWGKGRKRLERYHAKEDTPPLEFGSGWISSQAGVQPCEVFFFGDVHALTGEQILSELDAESDDIGCVFGGPPCQGFSRSGKRNMDDPRNELVFEFMRLVCEIHPRTFCMENVPGMLDMTTREGIPVIDALSLMAEEGGMGTFNAIRQSLADTAGVGAALRTKKAGASKPRRGSSAPRDRLDIDPEESDQLALEVS